MPPMSNKPVYLLNSLTGAFHNIPLLSFPLSKLVLKAALASMSQGARDVTKSEAKSQIWTLFLTIYTEIHTYFFYILF